MEHFITFVCLLSIILFASCSPYPPNYRQRRQEQTDFELMERYWREVLPLGFFVNQGAAETGDSTPESTMLSVRNKIEKQEGSGNDEEVRRNDIEHKPTTSILLRKDEEAKTVSDEKVSTEESGKLSASVEKNKSEETAKKQADPGDKTKVRNSVTCQGQKEWIQCDGPYELIKMKSAFWGRDNDYTCSKSSITHGLRFDKNCAQDESNTMSKVREACDNENVCEVVASGVYFDKSDCSDVYKYLKLEYECAPSESRIKESIS